MFIWMTLPEGMDAATLLETSIETVRVAFVPGRAFHPDAPGRTPSGSASPATTNQKSKKVFQGLAA